MAFDDWVLMPDSEANLYREYFKRFFADSSPFYVFIYYPIVLGIAGIVMASR